MGFFVTLRKNIPGIYNLPRKYRKYQVRSQLLSMPNIGQWPSGWEIVRWTMVRVFACRLILVQSTIPYYNFAGTTLYYMAHLLQMCPWSQISRPLAGNVAVCAVKIFTTFLRDITNTINQHSTAWYCLVYQSCKTFFLCPRYKRTLLRNRYWECLEGTCKGAAVIITIMVVVTVVVVIVVKILIVMRIMLIESLESTCVCGGGAAVHDIGRDSGHWGLW